MSSKALRSFDIEIFKLAEKVYEYQFGFDDSFFEAFENSPIQKGKGVCNLTLRKTATMMELDFKIEGELELTCDRSLEPFNEPLAFDQHLILKFGDEDQVLSEDIEIIERDTQKINIAQYLFEFISLAVPMKRLHPRFRDQNDDEDEVVYTSSDENEDNSDADESADPRWDILKKLKDN